MPILVTGATGFLGRAVTDALLAKKHAVRILSRHPALAKKRFPAATVLAGDCCYPPDVERAVKGCPTVIHLAGLVEYKDEARINRENFEATRVLADALAASKGRIVFASSVAAMGPTRGRATERDMGTPTSAYGWAKRRAEGYLSGLGIPTFALRIAPVYGPGAPWWGHILDLLDKHPVIPATPNRSQVLHVSEATDAVLRCLEKKRFPTGSESALIIAGKEAIPIKEVARYLIAGLGKREVPVPAALQKVLSRFLGSEGFLTENREYDISKAREAIGFEPWMDFRDHVEELVAWWRSERAHRKD